MQKAILMSLGLENQLKESLRGGIDAKPAEMVKPETIDSRIRDLCLQVASELPPPYDPLGDTFVFIDPPPQQPEQDDESYKSYIARHQVPMLLRKEVFTKLGSSYFENAFGPTNQHRVVRRRGLVGKLPDNVKYVIDLTPPTEGDQAVYLTTELCCSEGVRKWCQASNRWGVSQNLVAGQEEYMLSQTAKLDLHSPCLPLEYSPVRHRLAIERVLSALQGRDPKLDSAPKVWTTFAVAKYFGITNSPLTDYIVRWLRAFPNVRFLEVLPEIALRIADGLQCHELCRDTFAILVGEEALGTSYRSRVPGFDTGLNVHGRQKEQLPETLKTRLEYASKAFLERINAEFTSLIDDGMHWIDDLPEFQKLSGLGRPPSSISLDMIKLKSLLKAYVKGAIYTVLCTNFPYTVDQKPGTPQDDLFPRTSWEEIWVKLNPRERILTRCFWDTLRCCHLFRGPTNLHLQLMGRDCYFDTDGDAQKAILDSFDSDIVHNTEVEDLVFRVKNWYLNLFCNSDDHPGSLEERNSDHRSTKELPKKKKKNSPVVDGEIRQLIEDEFFRFSVFCHQAGEYLRRLSCRMVSVPDASVGRGGLDLELTHTLVCLTDDEWKFLPIWAGGNDDGSGGVFADDVPLSHDGFLTAGPKVVTGNAPNSTDDGFSVISHTNSSRYKTSLLNNKGLSDTVSRGFAVSHDEDIVDWDTLLSDKIKRSLNLDGHGTSVTLSSASSVTFDTDDIVPLTTSAEEVDDPVHNAQSKFDHMESSGTAVAQELEASGGSANPGDVFDDIFENSSEDEDDEEEDDADTINGDNEFDTDIEKFGEGSDDEFFL
jgi:hypothetical protein